MTFILIKLYKTEANIHKPTIIHTFCNRTDSSFITTTSTAAPINNGGAKSNILFKTENKVANHIVERCAFMWEIKRYIGACSVIVILLVHSGCWKLLPMVKLR